MQADKSAKDTATAFIGGTSTAADFVLIPFLLPFLYSWARLSLERLEQMPCFFSAQFHALEMHRCHGNTSQSFLLQPPLVCLENLEFDVWIFRSFTPF